MRTRIVAGVCVLALAAPFGQMANGQGRPPTGYEKVTTLKDAVEVARAKLVKDGKPEYAALVTEERMRAAVLTAVESYDLIVSDPSYTPVGKQYWEGVIRPTCLKVADGGWPEGCSFSSFYRLTTNRITYDGLGLRLHIDTPDGAYKGFALPVVDLYFGKVETGLAGRPSQLTGGWASLASFASYVYSLVFSK